MELQKAVRILLCKELGLTRRRLRGRDIVHLDSTCDQYVQRLITALLHQV